MPFTDIEKEACGRHPIPALGEWIVRGVDEARARAFIAQFQPWRMELQFDSGPKASEGQTFEPFNRGPLNKLRILLENIPMESFVKGRILDIGFNCGYNSLYLAQNFGAQVTGIDVVPKHKQVADALANMTGVEAEFLMANAEDFEKKNEFDLILHLGTLYHLANPVRSLEKCFQSLKVGGWFALETICYRASQDRAACKWIYGFGGDRTNFWALGEGAIESIAKYCGIAELKLIFEAWPEIYKREMSRGIWIGRKASSTPVT